MPRPDRAGVSSAATTKRLITPLALTALALQAHGQCDPWLNGPLAPNVPGLSALSVDTLTVFDPDGAGPHAAEPVAGGDFTTSGANSVSHIAHWDGTGWKPFGAGINGYAYSVEPYDFCSSIGENFLVAAGWFAEIGGNAGNNIQYWNGTTWNRLDNGFNDVVFDTCTWDPDGPGPLCTHLVAAGQFVVSGTTPMNHIAEYNGHWNQIGTGVDGQIRSVMTWNPTGNPSVPDRLVAAGTFTTTGGVTVNNIAQWDGASWKPLGTGLVNSGGFTVVYDLKLWDPDGAGPLKPWVIAAGTFNTAGGVPVNNVAAWDGTNWRALGAGTSGTVWKLTTWDPDGSGPLPADLIATGSFINAGGGPASRIARWNGTSWQPLGPGFNFDGRSLATWKTDPSGVLPDTLLAGGDFAFTGDNAKLLGHVATWDGSSWGTLSSFSSAPAILAMTNYIGRAVAAGNFPSLTSTGNTATNIASWTGTELKPFGTGTNANVRALKAFNPTILSHTLVVGGDFTTAGGVAANRIAIWNENDIFGIPAWSALGNGFNNNVAAIERFNNQIIAGGIFSASGATSLNRIAVWNGSSWQPLGTGLNNSVQALKVYNGSLYVGGTFTTAGGLSTGGLARWNGSAWSSVGGFFAGSVYALEVHNNELIIAGQFTGLPGSPNIAKYNGSTYSTLGTGGLTGIAFSLASVNGDLYVGGVLSNAGGVPVKNLARWNGSTWNDANGGTNDTVWALTGFHNEVQVGGTFTAANNSLIGASGWARYLKGDAPWLTLGPGSISHACLLSTQSFHVDVADGYTGVTYAWRHNGTPLANGTTPNNSVISGATTPDLTISSLANADAGSYDCVVSTSCGSTTSFAATLAVCAADFDCDGFVTGEDFDQYIAAFVNGSVNTDFDGDGFVTGEDFDAYIAAFAVGC